MSALSLALGRGRPAKAKKRKSKARRTTVSTEYNLLLTATLCLLAFGAVMVFSASSTTQVLQNGGLADSAYYLQRTLIVGAIGLVIMHFTARHGLVAIRRATPIPSAILPRSRGATPAAIRVAPMAKAITSVVPMSGCSMISRQAAPVISRIGMKPWIERTRFGSRASMSAA